VIQVEGSGVVINTDLSIKGKARFDASPAVPDLLLVDRLVPRGPGAAPSVQPVSLNQVIQALQAEVAKLEARVAALEDTP
jgi:hypothetical protein